MNTELTDFPLPPVFLISVAVICLAGELGRRLGVRRGRKGGDNVATAASAKFAE